MKIKSERKASRYESMQTVILVEVQVSLTHALR
jgi:hypothetical protein